MTKGLPMGAWDAGQVRMFAKRIAESPEGRAWWAFPLQIRNAIISHHVLMVMFSIHGQVTIDVDDVRELRVLIETRLAEKHNMKTHP